MQEEMIATSISQSRRLLEAGIDPQTADMFWRNADMDNPEVIHQNIPALYDIVLSNRDLFTFAWSLSALILLLPEHTFYRIARTRGKDIEGIFEDCVTYLCKKK